MPLYLIRIPPSHMFPSPVWFRGGGSCPQYPLLIVEGDNRGLGPVHTKESVGFNSLLVLGPAGVEEKQK